MKIIKLNNFRLRAKVAAFDYDWTLVKPNDNGEFPKNADDWQWLRPNVPEILKDLYKKGYCIVVFTNQTKPWKEQHILNALSSQTLNLPICIAIAFDKANHKPSRALYDAIFNGTKPHKLNETASFFAGDALGRPGDWADTDKLFAEAVGLSVKSPEEIFKFEPRAITQNVTATASAAQEIVVLVGYPGSGKSTITRNVFEPAGYEIIHGDVLKTQAKMIKAGKLLLQEGKSVVFDATNGTKEKRASYITLGQTLDIPVRCVHVNTSFDEAFAYNNLRPKEEIVPKIVFFVYRKHFIEPSIDEGFTEVNLSN
jgi:bifunctional polynucleotide phosphatase/kinase